MRDTRSAVSGDSDHRSRPGGMTRSVAGMRMNAGSVGEVGPHGVVLPLRGDDVAPVNIVER